ncbi:TonB family protein [Sorangium sp. So ce233]|uniref:AgmX/PglI C-terminal domain-containing protein n=1 Tax=Sorangium sp. So ce233 TaxID=3133290 RepID=UPI003F62DC66
MSSRRTGLVLVLALAAGCAAPPSAQAPAQPASSEPAGTAAPSPAGTAAPATGAPPATGGTPAAGEAPPPGSQVPGATAPAAPAATAPPRPSAASGGGSVKPGAAVATGTLGGSISEAQVREVVEKHGELFDECYKIGVKTSPKFMGKVTVKATIGPSGKVNRADVLKSTTKSQQVDRCVADAFEKMQFPRPEGGVTTVITFPIEFSGVELVQP